MNWQDIVNKLRSGAGAVSRAPDVAGRGLGNIISRNRAASGIVNRVGDYGGRRVASAIQGLTGVRDFREAGQQFSRGQDLRALGNLAEGALNLGLSATGFGGAATGVRATRAAGQPLLSAAGVRGATRALSPQNIVRSFSRDPLSTAARRVAAARPGLTGTAARTAALFGPGSALERAVVAPLTTPYITAGVDRLMEYMGGPQRPGPSSGPARGQQYVDPITGFVNTYNPRSGIYEVTGRGGTPAASTGKYGTQYVDPVTGFVNTWNPRSGIYEVTGVRPNNNQAAVSTPATTETTVTGGPAGVAPELPAEGYIDGGLQEYMNSTLGAGGAGGPGGAGYSSELAALDPEQMEELLQAARDEERRYQEVLNQIGRTTSEKERAFFDLQRGVGREVAGGRQTASSALAQLGLDTSPATSAYAEYLGATGQRRIATGRADLAKILADLRQQRGTAESRKLAALREIDKATRRARVQNTMQQAGRYF